MTLRAVGLRETHYRGLIDTCRLDRLHKPPHLRIVPDTKGMIFERVQVYQIKIDDLLFFGAGSVAGADGSGVTSAPARAPPLFHVRLLRGGLALGLFVPRFGRLGLIGSGLAILG